MRSLKEVGASWDAELNEKVLQVLKKGGNASALRQAITEGKKKDSIANELVAELMEDEE